MNVLVTVLSARNVHVSTHVRANKHVFLGVYDVKKAQLRGTLCKKDLQFMREASHKSMCLFVCMCMLCAFA